MRFSYIYKTSDGVRHEDRIEAPSREAAFEDLRERGIRAIKVVSLSGSKANGEEKIVNRKRFIVTALILGLLAGVAGGIWYARTDFRDKRIVEVERRAAAIVESHRADLKTLHMDELCDYRRIAQMKGVGALNQKIVLFRMNLNEARGEVRELFREPFETFAAGTPEADELRRIYSVTLDALDLEESRLSKNERAYHLLDENRAKWKCEGETPVFSDARLEVEFLNLTRQIGSGARE